VSVVAGPPQRSAAQPWLAVAGFAPLLHFAWEMLQAPLYAGMAMSAHWTAVLECGRATRRAWAAYLATGLGLTLLIEAASVYWLGRWAYAPEMPKILGMGAMPLMQWLLLPPIVLWLAARHLCVRPRATAKSVDS
jgi:hypothetical protein